MKHNDHEEMYVVFFVFSLTLMSQCFYDDCNEVAIKVHGFVVCEFSSLAHILICLVGCRYPCGNCHASTDFITKVIKREQERMSIIIITFEDCLFM